MSRLSPTTTNKDKRHNKHHHNDAGIQCKKLYDRSLSRQVDNKVERKSGYFTQNPEDELHLEDVEAEFRQHPLLEESESPAGFISELASDEMSDQEIATLFSLLSDEEIEQFCKLKERGSQTSRQAILAKKETLFPKF